MSKITNPITEASVTCGFYNSNVANSRKYYASQMSAIFDGIIRDGIFASIGDCLVVNASSGNTVNVGTGKCWFNHTWTLNDAPLPIDCGEAEVLLNRIDAIVVEINTNDNVQDNFIKIEPGIAATDAVRKPLKNGEEGVYQYALCYINRPAGSTEIKQEDITNMVGGEETPFITGILEVISVDKLLGQWQDQLDRFVAKEESDIDMFMTNQENDFNEWYAQMKILMANVVNELDTWTIAQKNTILDWFENLQVQLSGDAAVNLQLQINREKIERMLLAGLVDCEKTISDDAKVITSTDTSGRRLVKTFNQDFSICTTVLYDKNGTTIAEQIKHFAPDGSTTSEVHIYEIETQIES